MPGYVITLLSGRLVGASDLSGADMEKIGLRGFTETWQFDVGDLHGLARMLWDRVRTNGWKVADAGISFNGLFPYAEINGSLCIYSEDLMLISHRYAPTNRGSGVLAGCQRPPKVDLFHLQQDDT
jgi:hypothetical protein